MKKTIKKQSGSQKKNVKKMLIAKGEVPAILHTSGAEMPDASNRKGSSIKKDARNAFR